LPVLAEHRSSDAPAPWPTTVGGGAVILGGAPQGEEPLKAQASPSWKPGACGPSAQQPGRDRRVPSAPTRACMAVSASKERGKPEADDWAQQLRLGRQAAGKLGDPRLGQSPVCEGLREGLARGLGLRTWWLEAFLGCESTALSGFGLLVRVSFPRGPGALLRTVLVCR